MFDFPVRIRQEYGDLIEQQPEHDFSPAFEKKMQKKWLKRIAQKSDLLKNPNPQRGRK